MSPTLTPPRDTSVSHTAEVAVSVRNLSKRFGDFAAVDDISFDVRRGEIFGFLGPNGSGKTTTIRMLTGTSAPTGGSAYVLSEDIARHPDRVQPRIGYMSQKFSLFEDLTVEENLRFYAGVYDVRRDQFDAAREYVLDMADLRGRENVLTGDLSTGLRQRLALGTATIHSPELLFLDEPTSGVDPVARRRFWDLLNDLSGRGVTLFVTTHYMEEVSNCSRIAFMFRGRIIADGTPSAVRASMPGFIVKVRLPAHDVAPALADLSWVVESYAVGTATHVVLTDDAGTVDTAATALRAHLAARGYPDVAIEAVHPSIEDAFVRLVSSAS